MNKINQIFAGTTAGAATAVIAIICGAIAIAQAAPAGSAVAQHPRPALRLAADHAAPVAQDEANEDDKDVPTSQVDKYINVYQAMQKDHGLTVEQAASKQGLTVAQFRDLEGKIERNDTLRERVRKALRHEVNPKDKESSED